MKHKRAAAAIATAGLALGSAGLALPAGAQSGPVSNAFYEVTVTVTNLAPEDGTFQTPVWVGLHGGSFDLYDRGEPVSAGLERLAEDGATSGTSAEFDANADGQDATLFGPNGPIAPGEQATRTFLVQPREGEADYLSFASMVIPSNDAFIANGDPLAHRLFDERGRFIGEDFVVTGADVLDAGTEVNDESPTNTAFFGQAAPNTGEIEGEGVELHRGFDPIGSGGILDSERFAGADFTADGYEALQVQVSAERVDFRASSRLRGGNEVPRVNTRAVGSVVLRPTAGGGIDYSIRAVRIDNVVAAHLHYGARGENGPVVAGLLAEPAGDGFRLRLSGTVTEDELVGPLEGMSTADLWRAIDEGLIYVNIHTTDFPGGELRSNL